MNQWAFPAFPVPVQFTRLFSLPEHDQGFIVRNVPKRMRAVMEQGKTIRIIARFGPSMVYSHF